MATPKKKPTQPAQKKAETPATVTWDPADLFFRLNDIIRDSGILPEPETGNRPETLIQAIKEILVWLNGNEHCHETVLAIGCLEKSLNHLWERRAMKDKLEIFKGSFAKKAKPSGE